MQRFRRVFAAVVAVAASAGVSSGAEAGHYRYSEVIPAAACGPVPPPARLYIYPAANWEPFFRRHFYRYGPLVACDLSVVGASVATPVVSVRY